MVTSVITSILILYLRRKTTCTSLVIPTLLQVNRLKSSVITIKLSCCQTAISLQWLQVPIHKAGMLLMRCCQLISLAEKELTINLNNSGKTKTQRNFEDAVVMSKQARLTNKKACLAIP